MSKQHFTNDPNSVKYDLSKFTVLIVDDFNFITEILRLTLLEMGVKKVHRASDGLQAKELLASLNNPDSNFAIDVIILDWLMPTMGGEELLKWIRNHKSDKIRFLPVVVCSAYTTKGFVEKVRDAGATEVIVKPVSAEKLASRIQYVIEKPRPFLKNKTYFGPDRRRKIEVPPKGERRKADGRNVEEHHERP